MMPPFVQVGSVGYEDGIDSFGGWHKRQRFARFSVTETAIKIRLFPLFWLRRYTFAAAAVSGLSTCMVRTYISRPPYRGLEITHTVTAYPRLVVFWSPDLEALIIALQQRGFQI